MPIRNLPIKPLKFDTAVTVVGEHRLLGLKFGMTGVQPLSGRLGATLHKIGWSKACHYCQAPLRKTDEVYYDDTIKSYTYYEICEDCGFWRWQDRDNVFPNETTIPLAQSFDPDVAIPALDDLAVALAKDPSRAYALDATRFEILVGSIIRNYFDCEVFHCGRSGDGGVDLIAVRGEKPILIQVKRRTRSDASEGIEAVKLMVASTLLRGETEAVVVTSARRFTSGAKRTAKQFGQLDRRFRMSLIDMSRLLEIVEATCAADRRHPYLQDKDRRAPRTMSGTPAKVIYGNSGMIVRTVGASRADYFAIERDAFDRVVHVSADCETDLLDLGYERAVEVLAGMEGRIISMTLGYDRTAIPREAMEALQDYVVRLPQSRIKDLVEMG